MSTKYDESKLERGILLYRAPLLGAAAIICLLNGFNLYRLLVAPAPRNPWETTEIVEAWRSLQGMPVYELSPQGHATHMYGALVPWLQGELFRWSGPNNISGRVLSLAAAIAVVTIIALCMRSKPSAWHFLIGWAALLGVNHRSGHYFAENRPDMPALLMATLALVFFYQGRERRRWIFFTLGSACVVIGFFIKQPVSVFSSVPLLVLVLNWRKPRWSEVLTAALPLASMAVAIVLLRLLSPVVYHYMVEVPGGYSINWPRAVKYFWEVLLDTPLFLFLFGEWIVFDNPRLRGDTRMEWLLAVLAVTVPFCAVSHAKVGGWPNSMLPALLAMTAFCALRIPRLLVRLEGLRTPVRSRLAYATFIALLMLMTTFPHLTVANGPLVAESAWNQEYWKAVAIARALPGKVVCPEDPSIPLYAKKYAGMNVFSEKDARPSRGAWPKATPRPVLAELGSAEFVVDVANYWGENVDGGLLQELGFEQVHGVALDAQCYQIWRRRGVHHSVVSDRTAALERRDSSAAR